MGSKRKAKKTAKTSAPPLMAVEHIVFARKHKSGKMEYLLRLENGTESWHSPDSLFVRQIVKTEEADTSTADQSQSVFEEVIEIDDSDGEAPTDVEASGLAEHMDAANISCTDQDVRHQEAPPAEIAEVDAVIPVSVQSDSVEEPSEPAEVSGSSGSSLAAESAATGDASPAQFECICKMRKRKGLHQYLVKLAQKDEYQWIHKAELDQQMIIAFYQNAIKWF